MKIHAYDKTVRDIFSATKKYIVPRFQREYSWETDELNEFWDDILTNIKFENGKYFNEEYFIGSLVLVGEDHSTEFLIVDGQQRLTTITILFSALVQAFKTENDDDLANGLYSYIEDRDLNNKMFFKLENESPKPFFQRSIQHINNLNGKPTTEEEHKLEKAFNSFLHKLNELKKDYTSNQDYIDYLKAIRDQVLKLKTIFITVDNEDDAYTIFETLNSKGINLTTIDLIKNLIFKVLNSEHPADDAKNNWSQVKKNLSSRENKVDIKVFFRHYWLSNHEYLTENKLYRSFKKNIPQDVNSMSNFLNNLIKESDLYGKITSPSLLDWKQQEERQVYDSLNALNIFKVTQVRTLLLALVSQRSNNKISLTDFVSCLKTIEHFHFMFSAICSLRPSGLEVKYSKFARDIRACTSQKSSKKIINSLTEDLLEKVPTLDTFTESFKNLWFTNEETKDKKLIQYIFKKWENHLITTSELEVSNITLEHIAPQADSTFDEVIGMIGNLIPLDKDINNKAAAKSFIQKLQHFEKSELRIVKDFVNQYERETNWSVTHINNRTETIAKEAYEQIWKIKK